MSVQKWILLFGAGKSATVLIDYLKITAEENSWHVIVADENLDTVISKVGQHQFVKATGINIEDDEKRQSLIAGADVVISMMPPHLHYKIAIDCISLRKHLLTASYIDEKIRQLEPEIKKNNLVFLCEMGLDPGIDHMSAMQLFDRIRTNGGVITSFKSHCGGLVAPESDDNPFHYKISWNPRNIVLAGKAGAVYKENDVEVHLPYEKLFDPERLVQVPGNDMYAFYPNRDSLAYIKLYQLEKVKTFVRTTLRHPDFSFGWKNIVDLKLTDEEKIYETEGLSVSDFFRQHFDRNGFGEWLNNMLTTRLNYAKDMMEKLMDLIEVKEGSTGEGTAADNEIMMIDENGSLTTVDIEDVKDKAAESAAHKMHEANLSMKQLFFLGLDDNTPINKGLCSAADVLQFILERKLALQPGDKDMIVMLHEIEYEMNGTTSGISSSLIVKGENSLRTAMAKTVGLPLGIAAKLILQGMINETGLHIPVSASIYEPVLKELQKHGIVFNEMES